MFYELVKLFQDMSSFNLVISGKGFQLAGSFTAYSVTKVSTWSVDCAYVRVMGRDTDVGRLLDVQSSINCVRVDILNMWQ